MAITVKLELPIKAFKNLAEYLTHHEEDIAMGINDFGDLRGLYIEIFEEEPKEFD